MDFVECGIDQGIQLADIYTGSYIESFTR